MQFLREFGLVPGTGRKSRACIWRTSRTTTHPDQRCLLPKLYTGEQVYITLEYSTVLLTSAPRFIYVTVAVVIYLK